VDEGQSLTYVVGGWAAAACIALRADGLSVVMMLTTAIVITGAGLSPTPISPRSRASPRRAARWCLDAADRGVGRHEPRGDEPRPLHLYVALELLTFAAVPLVSLDGRAATLAAALRYLMFALLGSVLYLLGAVLLYGAYGTLDISLLAARVQPEPVAWVAAALMTAGLLAKTALFPLHLWLPPAHAGLRPPRVQCSRRWW